ncbi:MAG: flagellar hook-associated protein FlgK [Acidobacteria bacterium]|nr:flagellar hook-associated protein FlgK [Acidobacteriota bacterium]
MSGLNGSLSIALSALLVSQQQLETSANNVANANTPGFSRKRPDLTPGDPVVLGRLSIGTGVVLKQIQSLRDPILELRISQETQTQGQLDTTLGALQQIQVGFSGTDSGIGDAISKFFDSLQQLSTDPTSLSLRQAVLTAAGNLATTFNTEAHNLQAQRSNLDLNVVDTVGQINTLTAQIAGLNKQVSALENVHEDAGIFIDQRTEAIRQLSSLVDVSVIQTESGIALTTSNGTPLVAGERNFPLTTQIGTGGIHQVLAGTVDVTGLLTSGKLGGLLQVRDTTIPTVLGNLDQLATGLATALNTANRTGFDLNGVQGTDLFVPPVGAGAAAALTVSITDPALIAASSDGTPGSNGNLALLSAVHDQAIVAGQKPLDFYSRLVFTIGTDTANAGSDLEASSLIVRQLGDQRASVSGVSLDEEAASIIRYQAAYQAAARVVTTVNTMLDLAVNLGRD